MHSIQLNLKSKDKKIESNFIETFQINFSCFHTDTDAYLPAVGTEGTA